MKKSGPSKHRDKNHSPNSASTWRGKRVLVTGAGGFIGSHVVYELVESGAVVTALIRYNSRNDWGMLEHFPPRMKKPINVVPGDVCDFQMIREVCRGKDVVFHLAALIPIPYSYIAPASFLETNAMGSLNIFRACLDAKVSRIIHTSTSETYGTARYVPIDEEHPLQAQSPYSASKISADKVAESFCRSYGAPVATVRPFNTYGPGQSARAIIPTIISQAMGNKGRVSIGSLHPVRDFTYVKDTVAGFLAVAGSEHTVGEVVNIGSGSGITIGELVEMVSEVTGIHLSVRRDKNRVRAPSSEVDRLICDNRKALELCEWKPVTGLKKGLSLTVDYIRRNLHFYKFNMYNK